MLHHWCQDSVSTCKSSVQQFVPRKHVGIPAGGMTVSSGRQHRCDCQDICDLQESPEHWHGGGAPKLHFLGDHFLSLANLSLGVGVQVLVIWAGTGEKQLWERLWEQLLLKCARSNLLPLHLFVAQQMAEATPAGTRH